MRNLYLSALTQEYVEKDLRAYTISFDKLLEQSEVIRLHIRLTDEIKEFF